MSLTITDCLILGFMFTTLYATLLALKYKWQLEELEEKARMKRNERRA